MKKKSLLSIEIAISFILLTTFILSFDFHTNPNHKNFNIDSFENYINVLYDDDEFREKTFSEDLTISSYDNYFNDMKNRMPIPYKNNFLEIEDTTYSKIIHDCDSTNNKYITKRLIMRSIKSTDIESRIVNFGVCY